MVFWLIEDRLAGSEIPDRSDLEYWKALGIACVVSLVEDQEFLLTDIKSREKISEFGFEVLREPVRDGTAPSIKQLLRIVKWIDKQMKLGKKVLVHCFGGFGRTGTVLAAYLIYTGVPADEAIKKVRQVRPYAIEVLEQEQILYVFEKYLREGNK